MSVLLDTHVLLWWKGDPARLSRAARRAIGREQPVLVSPVSFWEVSTLLRLGRIELDRDVYAWMADLTAEEVQLAPLTAEAAADAGSWPADAFHGDPADRLIFATARDLRVPLVSKDERMRAFAQEHGGVTVVW